MTGPAGGPAASGHPAGPALPPTLAANPRLSAWVDLSAAGAVTVSTGKVEYGQGIWTALAQVAAEELEVGLDRVTVAPVRTDRSPDEGITSGSRSVEESGAALRQACAQARMALLAAAARRLGADPASLRVADGRIVGPGGPTGLTYWTLVAADPAVLDRDAGPPVPASDPRRWSVAGRSAPRRDLPAKVTGRPAFLHDLALPGMRHGRVVRPPAVNARLAGLPDAAALARAGLPPGTAVVRDGSFLGVVAEAERDAVRAAGVVRRAASWLAGPEPGLGALPPLPDCDDLAAFLRSAPAEESTVARRADQAAASRAVRTVAAEFTRPYLAHASMAPSCAIARWDGEQVTVWSHSQGPFALRGAIAAALGIAPGQVTVCHAEGAGAYGHNGADDAAFDAVLLARAAGGRPVRVLWSREDELGWAPLGPAMLARIEAGLSPEGRIVTWRQDVWSNGFIGRPGSGGHPRLLAAAHVAGGEPAPPAPDGPPTGAMGSTRNAVPGYDIPDLLVRRHRLLAMPLRTSSLRSLGAFLNVFAIESVIDELAAAAGADPVAFRLAHLSDPRAARVLREAARLAGWDARPRADGTGWGVGYARYKGLAGYCAAVAEVEAHSSVRVRRLWVAADVGKVISPDGVANQLEGGAIQSASWALKERVRFSRSAVTSVTWDDYPILRFSEVPRVQVAIMESEEPEAGAGEVAQGPVAAAIGNALADAVGVRVRDLPLTREQVARAIERG